nr:lngG [Providencia sp. PROV216]
MVPVSVQQQTEPKMLPSETAGTATTQITVGQEQIVRALQDDIVFERQKRQLSNELALEKLRAELQKVRSDSKPVATMSVAPPPVVMPKEIPQEIPAIQVAPPTVVLVSQIAGVSRVGVSINGQLQFVGRHETFSANGKRYRLVLEKKGNQLVAREAKWTHWPLYWC